MTGKSHLMMNGATAVAAVDTYFLMTVESAPAACVDAANTAARFLFDSGDVPMFVFGPSILFLYFLGALLPDIDTPYSMLGRVIHVPIAHRTWLHAIYMPLIFLVLGIWFRPLFWLGAGTFFHLFWDGLSRSGVNWFYPRKHKKHILKVYHTSHPSEYIFGTVVCLLVGVLTGVTVYLRIIQSAPPFTI